MMRHWREHHRRHRKHFGRRSVFVKLILVFGATEIGRAHV